MKRVLLTFLISLLVIPVAAQVNNTVKSIGASEAQKTVTIGNRKITFGVSVGGVINSTNKTVAPLTALTDEVVSMAGFPQPVRYFPQIFSNDFFVSKGYFPNVVQLRWDILTASTINQFRIFRKPIDDPGDSVLIAVTGPDEFFYQDDLIDFGVVYEYTVFARGIADDLRIPFVNYVQQDGFAFPSGSVSGQVKFEGGTAVQGVTVVATTEGSLSGQSVNLSGDNQFLKVRHTSSDEELELRNGFSLQLWTKYEGNSDGVIFSKGDDYELRYNGSRLSLKIANSTLDLPFTNPVDSFFHVSATYDPTGNMGLQAIINDKRIFKKAQAVGNQPAANFRPILFGRNIAGAFYKGKLDEIRLWQKNLSDAEILSNFSRHIGGTETDLSAYWRFDMGIGRDFYDFARKGSTFRENHGRMLNASFSSATPLRSQLAFRGLTDAEGNYVITGFPYESVGSLYKFTALKEFHSFDPPQQTRFVGPSESIHNEVDFTDISSFKVSGTVRYKDGPFPVEGVSILVDGQPSIDGDGKLILTDQNGAFTVDVPIGLHSIKMSKPNHTFENDGRFPQPTAQNDAPLFDFQQPLAGLEFVNNTLIKVAGRVVGGPVEEAKDLGFSLSKNNIGNATITLTTQNGKDLTFNNRNADVTEKNAGAEINSGVSFSTKNITIKPDRETGEFIAFLPPEQYRVTSVSAGSNTFDNSFLITLDLRQTFAEEMVDFEKTLAAEVNGTAVPGFAPFNEADFESINKFTRNDTLFTVGKDSFKFQKRQDFILRNKPTIQVSNLSGAEFFGEENFEHVNEATGTKQTIPLYDSETKKYAFGHPIFSKKAGSYNFLVELFEEYTNSDNSNAVDKVPVVDGKIEVVNELSISNAVTVLPLNNKGQVVYSFRAGEPNRTLDATTPGNSFTKAMNITAVSGKNGGIRTVYREGDPFRGIVFGSQSIGNNFVTTGPNLVNYILRDPPGSGSSATLTKGTTFTRSETIAFTDALSISDGLSVSNGSSVKTFAGVGAGVITEIETTASLDVGLTQTLTTQSNREKTLSTTLEKTISTSDDPLFVGEAADIFIGRSTNIVYGAASFLELIPSTDCELCGATEFQGFKIGTRKGLNFGAEFKTGFAFTQFHIEGTLIPNLENIRNSLLTYSDNPGGVVATDKPVYISRIPISDKRFGSSNTNRDVWGSQATRQQNSGPSYVIVLPDGYTGARGDTIDFYNKQIDSWKFWLAENERQKVQASLSENISFESGASVEQSVTTTVSETYTYEVDFAIDASVAVEVGVSIDEFGYSRSLGIGISSSSSSADATSSENTTTSQFNLSDGDIGDSYTVDVKNPKDGFGAVFSTRGGQTACPFEPETRTRYFEPGKHLLNAATVRREGPVITANEAVLANVPDNRAAQFTVNLSTDSESGEAFNYTLMLDPTSNPNGAAVAVNGSDIGDGFSFLVGPDQSITQTITVEQGKPDVFDYENLRFMLVSQCQFDPTEPQADLADTVHLSAYFVPGCSDVNISNPGENWIVNTNSPQKDTLNVTIDGYDLNLADFTRMQFQYRTAGEADFTTDMTFYNSLNVTQAEFDAAEEPKMLISDASIVYPFDMSSLPDQEYDIRVVALCDAGPGLVYETPSQVLRGTKDTQRPQLFGAPQPADGILSANDEILIRFNESIVSGTLTPSNFSVMGVLNNAPVNNNTSVNLDGINDYVRIEDGLDLGNSSFTIEFKLKRNTVGKEVIVFSKGFVAGDDLEIGFTADNKMFVDIGNQRILTSVTFTDVLNFNHFAITYDSEENQVFAYRNDEYILEGVTLTGDYSGNGPISLGRSTITETGFVDGNILDLRIWRKFRTLADVFASINQKLTGTEVALIGYWPFDEGFGNLSTDRARLRNATLFADWLVLPKGYSMQFDGVDDYLAIKTGSTVTIDNETDFTIEFWFNGPPSQSNAVMFSSGRGTSGSEEENKFDVPDRSLSIGFNSDGQLYVASNGQVTTFDIDQADLLDNNWHHFAMSVSRVGSARFFIDGEQQLSVSPEGFGGIFRSTMAIGARFYNVTINSVTQDMFFKGLIDEFRIWNSARTGDQIVLDRNAKLRGDEFGLRAYYPFDAFQTNAGVQLLASSLEDQFQNSSGPNGGLSTVGGGADFSTNTPNIGLNRPVQDVPYDFVVNNDELIITPKASAASVIERATLEISVANIEDLFGNRLASPITFTAFVDRNLVKWDKDQIEIEKAPNDQLSFNVDIVNLGGLEEGFNITNLPLWLKASPSSGSIDPQSRLTIEFTVNPGLNNGYYSEDIFLTTEFGFNEKLNIDLKVLEEAPAWVLDKTNFEFSMSVVAQLKIDGVISRDRRDMLSAFVNDELRGVASLQYVPELDQYMAFMDVFSNGNDGNAVVEFRAFDADQGIEFRKLSGLSAIFEAQKTHGKPSNPTILSTGELVAEKLNFSKGFSWRSFNLNSSVLDKTSDLLAGINAETNDRVTSANFIDVYTEGLGWLGSITNNGGYDPENYYLFFLKNGGEVDLVGTRVSTSTPINVGPGFNRIGFIPSFVLSVEEAFANLQPSDGDIVRGQFEFALYEEGLGWIGSLENLQPGQGYLYFSSASAAKSFSYPNATFLSSNNVARRGDEVELFGDGSLKFSPEWSLNPHDFPANMSIIGKLAVEDAQKYMVAAFDKEGLVGIADPKKVKGEILFFLTPYGVNEVKDLTFKAFNRTTGQIVAINEAVSYEPNALLGRLNNEFIFTLGHEESDAQLNVKAFPNPFESIVEIDLGQERSNVQMEVHGMDGRLLKSGVFGKDEPVRVISWDGRTSGNIPVDKGTYIIRIRHNEGIQSVKVIKR